MVKQTYLFDKDYMEVIECRTAASHKPPLIEEAVSLGMIRKNDLKITSDYGGLCRNASVAKWDGEKFWYIRSKFGKFFIESICHPEDDNGFDLFVPLCEINRHRKEPYFDPAIKPVEAQEK
jgi:hypothetical protein